MARKKKEDKEYLEPEEASKILNGGDPPYKLPEENGNGNGNGDRGSKSGCVKTLSVLCNVGG